IHVMWDLRKTLRCAVVEDMAATPQDIARQTIALFKAGGTRKENTVLLLVDNMPKMESLQNVLVDAIAKEDTNINMPVVIILSCTRHLDSDNVTVKMNLSSEEQTRFDRKLEEIRSCHNEESSSFHGFNIMQQNFDKDYVQNVIGPIHNKLNAKERSTQLFSILVLLSVHVPGSALLKLQCETFLRQTKPKLQDFPFEESMQSFMDLFVIFSKREKQTKRDFVQIAHPLLAKKLCVLLKDAGLTYSGTTKNLLKSINEDNKEYLYDTIYQLLVKRRKNHPFSDLIETIIKEEPKACVTLLLLACTTFPEDAFMRQLLARVFYLKEKKYSEAEKWAKKAINKSPRNSFIADTLGQVHKHHFKNPEITSDLKVAKKAIDAFRNEHKLAEEEVNASLNDENKKDNVVYNNRWLFGCVQVASAIFDELEASCHTVLRLEVPFESLSDKDFYQTLLPHRDLLLRLRDYAERGCEFFQSYLTYSRPSDFSNDPPYLYDEVTKCFLKYAATAFESNNLQTVNRFSGLLHCLYYNDRCQIAETWKEIVNYYAIMKEMVSETSSYVLLYLLANVCLSCVDQDLPHLIKYEDMKSSLCNLVRASQADATPELLFLSLIVFWPQEQEEAEERPNAGLNIMDLAVQLKRSYSVHYERFLHSRKIVPLFLLTGGTKLKRLVPRPRVDVLEDEEYVNKQWKNGAVWKNTEVQKLLRRVNGVIEKKNVFACYSDVKIPVIPDNKASVRGPGRVSFYLGFSIKGPVAFDINYETETS
uniref:Sterile alpha motif domain-containing protein 9-like n=1 Tax=Scleropages formosus TaxID=113540 RepID=A0A8C9V0N0_SCLFO